MEWAVFLDGAIVGGSELRNLSGLAESLPRTRRRSRPVSDSATGRPSVRFESTSGYNPRRTEQSRRGHDGARTAPAASVCVPLRTTRAGTRSRGHRERLLGGFFNRLVLHLAIGQAY